MEREMPAESSLSKVLCHFWQLWATGTPPAPESTFDWKLGPQLGAGKQPVSGPDRVNDVLGRDHMRCAAPPAADTAHL